MRDISTMTRYESVGLDQTNRETLKTQPAPIFLLGGLRGE